MFDIHVLWGVLVTKGKEKEGAGRGGYSQFVLLWKEDTNVERVLRK